MRKTKKIYSAKERQDYELRASKRGSVASVSKDGVVTLRSDFARGMHFARFQAIFGKRKAMARKHAKRLPAVLGFDASGDPATGSWGKPHYVDPDDPAAMAKAAFVRKGGK